MSVEFNEDIPAMSRPARQNKPSLFTRITYKLKLAKTEAEAQRVILIAALACLAATAYLLLRLAGVL